MQKNICLGLIPTLLLGIAVSSEANVNSLTASIDVGLDMDHYSYKGPTGRPGTSIDYNRVFTSPSLGYKTSDVLYGIDFRYAPSFRYDVNGSGADVDQNLSLSGWRAVTKEWKINIGELYVKSDDSTLTAPQSSTVSSLQNQNTIDQVSGELGRHSYWTDNTSISTDYTFLPDSVASLGYTFSTLKNDSLTSTAYQDYDKHNVSLSASYHYLPDWKVIAGGQYIRGLFSTPTVQTLGTQTDLSQYNGNMSLESYIYRNNVLSLTYGYVGTRYDSGLNDSDIHNLTAGWKRDVSKHLNFDVGAGPSYAKPENQEGKWGYNAHAITNYLIEHGKLGLSVDKSFSVDNFSGTSTGGYMDAWTGRGDFNYQLYEDLTCTLFASFQDQDHKDAISSFGAAAYNEKVYSTGVSMKYTFWRWYYTTVGYTFTRQTADNPFISQYDENRVFLTVGAEKEIFRW
jgi:hypothetical protein